MILVAVAALLIAADARDLTASEVGTTFMNMKGEAISTIGEIKARGYLKCGTSPDLVGFAKMDGDGVHQGFDADLCKAIAAAIFADPSKVEYIGLSSSERFDVLLSGAVDVLVRTTTWTAHRDIVLGLNFGGVNYYDGQAFMVRKGINSMDELIASNGASCIVDEGTTTIENTRKMLEGTGVSVIPTGSEMESVHLLATRSADCYSTDSSALAATLAGMPEEERSYWTILPNLYSKEPLGPVTRQGDDQFSDLVRWTLNTMVAAEEMSITKDNVAEKSFMLGGEMHADALGVEPEWAMNVIKAVGNYGESFAKHLYPIGLQRGMNALYKDGGLQYALP